MVYRGKPSLGCGTCRNRHIKCDQTRPICLVCQKSGRQCLGYRDWGELWVRDQTDEVTGSSDISRRRPSNTEVARVQYQLQAAAQQPRAALTLPKDQLALGHFYAAFVRPVQFHAPERSYFQIMSIVYLDPKPASALEAATLSLAFATYRGGPGGTHCMHEAGTNYQVALNRLQEALNSPTEASSNETLLTVLIMQKIEVVSASVNSVSDPGSHTEGAVALINMRGRDGFQDEISKKLLASTRGLAVMKDLKLFEGDVSLSHFPARSDLGIPFLYDDEHFDSIDTSSSLILPMTRISSLCDDASYLLDQPRSEHTAIAIRNLIARCHEVDSSLVTWAQTSSQPFVDESIAATSAESSGFPYSSESPYWGRIESYDNIFDARSWNDYRVARLFIHNILMRCHSWFTLSTEVKKEFLENDEASYGTSEWISHEMIDGICASVPYLLGRFSNELNGLGVYFLFAPLYFIQSATMIGVEQKMWILAQMIEVVHGIGVANSKVGIMLREKLDQLRGLQQVDVSERFTVV